MDVLIYSGQELFVLDGDALVQFVLDDNLLAYARDGDPSLQLLHATWLLEKTVDDLLKKDTAFEIVFFDSLAHSTYHTGASEYVVSARRLARSILLRRANLPQTRLHRFDSLEDEKWQAWYQHKRVSRRPRLQGRVAGAKKANNEPAPVISPCMFSDTTAGSRPRRASSRQSGSSCRGRTSTTRFTRACRTSCSRPPS